MQQRPPLFSLQIAATSSLDALVQLVGSLPLEKEGQQQQQQYAGIAAAAFSRAVVLNQGGAAGNDCTALLGSLVSFWLSVLPQAGVRERADVLAAAVRLQVYEPTLWTSTLAGLDRLCSVADGRDLANIAFALATAAVHHNRRGAAPGMRDAEDTAELLRVATREAIALVQPHGSSDQRSMTPGQIAMLRWAHETLEALQCDDEN